MGSIDFNESIHMAKPGTWDTKLGHQTVCYVPGFGNVCPNFWVSDPIVGTYIDFVLPFLSQVSP